MGLFFGADATEKNGPQGLIKLLCRKNVSVENSVTAARL